VTLQIFVVDPGDQPLTFDQANQHARGIGPAAEAERKQPIAILGICTRPVVPARKQVKRPDIAFQSPSNCASEYGKGLE
jgi:hypothetical protein